MIISSDKPMLVLSNHYLGHWIYNSANFQDHIKATLFQMIFFGREPVALAFQSISMLLWNPTAPSQKKKHFNSAPQNKESPTPIYTLDSHKPQITKLSC